MDRFYRRSIVNSKNGKEGGNPNLKAKRLSNSDNQTATGSDNQVVTRWIGEPGAKFAVSG
jgi:hypothetical protein